MHRKGGSKSCEFSGLGHSPGCSKTNVMRNSTGIELIAQRETQIYSSPTTSTCTRCGYTDAGSVAQCWYKRIMSDHGIKLDAPLPPVDSRSGRLWQCPHKTLWDDHDTPCECTG